MFSKMTISKRITFGYVVFFLVFLTVVAITAVRNVIALNDANNLDMYNQADIISNNALALYQTARIRARDVYLTKTYSDETFNNAIIANLDKSVEMLNGEFMEVAKDFITSEHRAIVNNIVSGISEYKKIMETMYGLDREKLRLEKELSSLGEELLGFLDESSYVINDIVTSGDEAALRYGNTVLSLHEFHRITDMFWRARVEIRNILFLDDISGYDAIKEYFRSIESALVPYESLLRNSGERDYDLFLSDLQRYESHVDDYRDLILQFSGCDAQIMSLTPNNAEYIAQASDITLTNLNNSVSSIIAGAVGSLVVIAVMFAASTVIVFLLALVIEGSIDKVLKKTVRELAEATFSVSEASEQLNGASSKLAQGSSEQASSIEETSATMTETASMINRNNENTHQALRLSKVAEESSLNTVHQVDDLIVFMQKLNDSAGEINKIIGTIDLIASQTTILALNASVEAVRAGDAGKSFAVVAEEVRNLAQKSTKAAESTTNIIKENILLSKEGAEKSQIVGESLKAINDDAQKVARLLGEISTASEEQARGVSQINSAMSQMERVSQSTAAISEESAASAGELNNQAGALHEITERIKKLVGSH